MNDLWIGLNADADLKKHIIAHGGKFLSAHVSQTNIYNGLASNGILLDSINAAQLAPYPSYHELRTKTYRWTAGPTEHINVGYLNLRYANLLTKKQALVKAAKQWAKKQKSIGNAAPKVFVYQMHSPYMSAADAVKKILPEATVILIVPDLPQFMDLHMSPIKKVLKKIDWRKIKRLMRQVDKYVLYSKHMATFLELKDDTWMVMEGSANSSEAPTKEKRQKTVKEKAIMYSGVCDLRYGIPLLLKAFSQIEDPDLKLWITGTGNAVELIKSSAEKDPRIIYYGYLPSRLDLLKKQRSAMAMINTRLPDEEASAYCFPSKLFEYMLTGNPVLSFRIPGIPDEYFDYLVEMKQANCEEIVGAFHQILQMTWKERIELGERTKTFIVENKNNIIQTKRIKDFLGDKEI